LSLSEHRRCGQKKHVGCLSPPTAGEFPRSPAAAARHKGVRSAAGNTCVFFGSFLPVEEDEPPF
jgi:hypothetical protein